MKSRKRNPLSSFRKSATHPDEPMMYITGRGKGAYEYAHRSFEHNTPLEIRGGDANAYVRLLKNEPWIHRMTAEMTARFPSSKIMWRLEENRLAVVAEMQSTAEYSSVSALSWQDILDEADRGAADPTQKLIRNPSDNIILPPPMANPSQPMYAVPHPVNHFSQAKTIAPFEAVRTSIPPLHRSKKSHAVQWLKVSAVFAAFIVVVLLIVSTPAPFDAQPSITVSGTSVESTVPGALSMHTASTGPSAQAQAIRDAHPPTEQSMVITVEETQTADESNDTSVRAHSSETVSAKKNSRHPMTRIHSIAPPMPSRSDVQAAMNRVAPKMAGCGEGQTGRMVLRMTFSGRTGRVLTTQIVEPMIHSNTTAKCAQNAARHAQLPPFAKNRLSIKYPFQLR